MCGKQSANGIVGGSQARLVRHSKAEKAEPQIGQAAKIAIEGQNGERHRKVRQMVETNRSRNLMNTWQECLELGELPKGKFDKTPQEFIAKRLAESPTGTIRLRY